MEVSNFFKLASTRETNDGSIPFKTYKVLTYNINDFARNDIKKELNRSYLEKDFDFLRRIFLYLIFFDLY